MKIGTMLRFDAMEGMEEKILALKSYGLNSCQINTWEPHLFNRENALLLKELLEKHDVEPSAFWCGWDGPQKWNFYEGPITLGLVPPAYRSMRIKNLCDGADFAKVMGITDVVTHMGFIPENPHDPEFQPLCDAVREVALHLKENGQYLLFETGQETPVTMLRCFETVGTGNLGVNLDTGNLIRYGKANPVDALDVLGKYVRNVHAKDAEYPVNGQFLGPEKPLGQGKVDFVAFFKKLKKLNYNTYVTIERECSPEAGQSRDIIEGKALLERVIAEVYGA